MIYEPRGRALEYSPLACNIAVGCTHGCTYCYGPGAFRVSPEDWPTPRLKKNAIKRFEASARKYAHDPREILFCFASDPYMNEESAAVMTKILLIAEKHSLRIQILTKNPAYALMVSGEIIQRNDWKLGTTILFLSESLREIWEPGAPSILSRLTTLRQARVAGISTWCSIEPVVDVEEALAVITAVRTITKNMNRSKGLWA